jgi:hypothetical protein
MSFLSWGEAPQTPRGSLRSGLPLVRVHPYMIVTVDAGTRHMEAYDSPTEARQGGGFERIVPRKDRQLIRRHMNARSKSDPGSGASDN